MTITPAVLVTGATGGIGQAICEILSAEGYGILAHFHRDQEGARALQAKLRSTGGYCEVVGANLAVSDGPARLAHATRKVIEGRPDKRLHGIVNNAAVLIGPSLDDMTSATFDAFFAVNTKAPLLLAKELLPLMTSGGSIVNISSASAHLSSPGNMLYAMSKTALESMTRNLAEVIAPRGIRANAVVPGYTDNGNPAFRDPAVLAYMSSFSPLGGVAPAEVVARAVRFLLSDEASRTTGSLLDVSGGSTLAPRGRGASSVRDMIRT